MDLKQFIIPVELSNPDENQKMGNKKFNTTDLVFLDSKEEIKNLLSTCDERLTSATDYALVNGISLSNSIKTRKGKSDVFSYWLRDVPTTWARVCNAICSGGLFGAIDPSSKELGVCPVVHLDIDSINSARKKYSGFFTINSVKNSNREVIYHTAEFGEYPKTKAIESDLLENLFTNNSPTIIPTGKKYIGTVDRNTNFEENIEYEYHNKKYVRVKINVGNKNYCFEDGTKIVMPGNNDKYVWVNVEPITWIIRNWDEMPKKINPDGNGKAKYIDLRTEEAIMSGIPFYPRPFDQNNTYWQNSTVRGMLNSINVCDIKSNGNVEYGDSHGGDFTGRGFLQEAFYIKTQPTVTNYNYNESQDDDFLQDGGQFQGEEHHNQEQKTKQHNPYNFVFDKPSNDDLLSMYVKSNASVFLHGPSGVGKSGRVKQLDPNATRITLRPQMNPEEIDGTLDRETGKFIQPLWYTQLTEKCKAEPDKKHVLFIDELTNVKPTVQSLVYSLVLDRAGKDGLWPLPDNAVVVAAGNENAGNLAAYPLTNALFRRFSHIYYEVDKDDWLDWATSVNKLRQLKHIVNKNEQRAKIHPAIIAYVISRGEGVLNQDLDEENPKIVTDPRKWEIASNVLYSTKNPNALLPAIGEELTIDFADFVQSIQLSVEDVLNGNYDKTDFAEMSISRKLSNIVGLCVVGEKDLLIVRKFIANTMGKEILATFDSLWIRNDPERAEIVAECSLNSSENKNNGLEL